MSSMAHLSEREKGKGKRKSSERDFTFYFLLLTFYLTLWGYSSVGRAPALHAGSQEFESPYLHQTTKKDQQKRKREFSNSSRQVNSNKRYQELESLLNSSESENLGRTLKTA